MGILFSRFVLTWGRAPRFNSAVDNFVHHRAQQAFKQRHGVGDQRDRIAHFGLSLVKAWRTFSTTASGPRVNVRRCRGFPPAYRLRLVDVFGKAGADRAGFNQADLNAAVAQLHAQRVGPGLQRIFTGGIGAAAGVEISPITEEVITMRPSPCGSMRRQQRMVS
jgi:hypothetical protein